MHNLAGTSPGLLDQLVVAGRGLALHMRLEEVLVPVAWWQSYFPRPQMRTGHGARDSARKVDVLQVQIRALA